MALTASELAARREDMLDKVRKLIAKADGTTIPSEEQAFREKADELMERFSIEMWMVEAANENSAARKPVGKMLNIDWLYNHPFQTEIWTLYHAAAYFTRCVVASWKWHDGKIGVVGLEQDIDYFDLVFTHLLLEMGRKLLPQVDPNRDAEWNAYSLRSKHLGWPEVAFELSKAGMLPWPKDASGYELEGWKYERVVDYAGLATAQKWRRAARKLYRDYCRKNGVEPESSKQPAVSAKSYAMGWSQEVRRRLHANEEARLETYQGTGAELALRDIRTVVKEAVEDIFPRPKPRPLTPEEEERLRRQRERDARRPLPKLKEAPFDPDAYARGTTDAKDVDLAANPHRRVGLTPKELES